MGIAEQENLKREIQHIFDSGANEIRVLEMVRRFIDNRDRENKIDFISPVIDSFEPNYEEMSKEDLITYCEYLKLKQYPIKWKYVSNTVS